MKKKSYNDKVKKAKKDCDELWAEIVKKKSNYQCVAGPLLNESCSNIMNAHHIEGRCLNVRWDLDNGMCLCQKHHTLGSTSAHATAHSGQVEFHKKVMVEVYGTEKLEELKQRSNQNRKWCLSELEDLKEYLKSQLNNA